MEKPFDYPPDGWQADSHISVPKLAIEIQRRAITMGIKIRLLNASYPSMVGFDKAVQSTGFNVTLRKEEYGTRLEVYVYEDSEDALNFLHLWKQLSDEGKVWDTVVPKSTFQSKEANRVENSSTKADTKARRRKINRVREIVIEAVRDYEPYSEFMKLTVSEIAHRVSGTFEYEFVIDVFRKKAEKGPNLKKYPVEDMVMDNFFTLRTLYKWLEGSSMQ